MTETKDISIPEFSLVLLIGASGTGKSSFAAKHFKPTEVVSSDTARGWVSDDETDQSVTGDAFELVHAVIEKRLKNRKLTVVDATNVQPNARKSLVALARKWHCLPVGIVFQLPEKLAIERNKQRPDRQFGPGPVKRQMLDLKRSLRGLKREGIRARHILKSVDEIDAVTISRAKLWNDKREETGPFDIIGDVHGCADELETLLVRLGYGVSWTDGEPEITAPEGRKAVFVGDLVDRGPRSPDVLRIAKHMVDKGTALAVVGNHDDKLKRYLDGRNVKQTHGLAETIEQLGTESQDFRQDMREWLDGLISHYVLDEGQLVVAHAGLKEEMQGRASGAIRSFCMYGETTGETDEYGLPVRYNWAAEYSGKAKVVYGHTPVPEAQWTNGTICIDTGCVFGGKLTALQYPEMELVEVPAEKTYYEPVKPLDAAPNAEDNDAGKLNIKHVLGKQAIETRDMGMVIVREDESAAALEVMSRFAADPRWLVHLPPTMSPPATSGKDGWLERPEEAFAYYREQGVGSVVVEKKHMGSRALITLARDAEAASKRFDVDDGSRGIIVSRTGRRFFPDAELEKTVLDRLDMAMQKAGLWEELESDWVLWDAEIMPWNLKASSLISQQYAPVGAAAVAGLSETTALLEIAKQRGVEVDELYARSSQRLANAQGYRTAYNHYVGETASIDDIEIAPFHLLASGDAVHSDKDHMWHMDRAHRLAVAESGLIAATPFHKVDLADDKQVSDAIQWWEDITAEGGEGMVVKPLQFVVRGKKGLVQPAIKCRGKEYLRIIYGPDYDMPKNLERLRKRGLGQKRRMALREFALGLEGLHRFVENAPFSHVHQCAFGVLAMESEPVDPRL
ncbi:polynucleotide 3'-phosphatase /polynucleotide 5'-hydroxyl-kinase /polynucleotide 2',3'-cyclic phosphate phosphodiesterase [Parasphingorhabdus marina DSM 22363]|uniref:Polynucleotide 3'-phosphatase /polynucleotide 5'-hydroxyl-kinase /polynucleotide 2',3'-cyclic phosphate phosphodiesterase n=1 Tax=Parasphingorhabdus marina DSM 22363 TaxID=1123272 RepID=A0A1N6CMD5_9SPHN|nr:polynucleotide kinase-phosphatase [Parasphingorhabdus marina]SIN59731.1 polynucleotide 3'-phosphatase /polynucleotide 5'-hydroxyl-kinase /polynucleotide 2',3'-cyclic phosphate phosphodiesterase [Parasphingorhabdus marina DSM 22363]